MDRPGHYRAPMRSQVAEVGPWAGVQRALAIGLCGVGGRLPSPPTSLDDAVERTAVTHDDRAARRLRRFAAVPTGAVVWTRDEQGRFFRGRLRGRWRYDRSEAAARADLVHVRSCRWTEVDLLEVPEPVRASFARGGRNFQRVRAMDQ